MSLPAPGSVLPFNHIYLELEWEPLIHLMSSSESSVLYPIASCYRSEIYLIALCLHKREYSDGWTSDFHVILWWRNISLPFIVCIIEFVPILRKDLGKLTVWPCEVRCLTMTDAFVGMIEQNVLIIFWNSLITDATLTISLVFLVRNILHLLSALWILSIPNFLLFTRKKKRTVCFFLDISLNRLTNRKLQRNIHMGGRYLQLTTLVPVAYGGDLVRILFDRVQTVCISDGAQKLRAHKTNIVNPRWLFGKFHRTASGTMRKTNHSRKARLYCLTNHSWSFIYQINGNLESVIIHTHPMVQLPLSRRTRLSSQNHSSCFVDLNALHVVYQFTCSRGDARTGRTDRCLAQTSHTTSRNVC